LKEKNLSQNKNQELTERQEKFLKEFAKTGYDLTKRRECAVKAGYPYANAPASSMRAINKISQNEKLQRALGKAGVNMKFVAEKLKENASHENVFASNRALDMIINVMDAKAPQRLDISKHQVTEINITLNKAKAIEEITGERIIDVDPIEDE